MRRQTARTNFTSGMVDNFVSPLNNTAMFQVIGSSSMIERYSFYPLADCEGG